MCRRAEPVLAAARVAGLADALCAGRTPVNLQNLNDFPLASPGLFRQYQRLFLPGDRKFRIIKLLCGAERKEIRAYG
jgi:hypothetical protein